MNLPWVLPSLAVGVCAAAALILLSVRLRGFISIGAWTLRREPKRGAMRTLFAPALRWRGRRAEAARRRRFDRAVLDWVDLLQMAAAAGMNLQAAVTYTAPLADSPLREALTDAERRSRAGDSLVVGLQEVLDGGGEQAAAQVAHLLYDSARRGLPLRSALGNLKGDMLQRRRHLARRRLKTLGLKIAVGTVFFLLPPAFVVVIMPSLLTFFGW